MLVKHSSLMFSSNVLWSLAPSILIQYYSLWLLHYHKFQGFLEGEPCYFTKMSKQHIALFFTAYEAVYVDAL